MHSVKYITAAIFLIVLSASSCATRKTDVEKVVQENRQRTDSVSRLIEKKVTPILIPPSKAILPLNCDDIKRLPIGAFYEAKDGQATARVEKDEDGIKFVASCDSLMLLVEELTTEVYHLQTENTALKEDLKEIKTIEVNKLSGLQWFQVWVGRIALLLIVLYVIVKIYKRKKIL
ncbi:hypothetical protein LJC38_00095 [Parabacteroides sp. OttesenSCG-928-K15]|nr:hypothetical protein [Parabacteroides sp. OttesenSCG-928-K15]